MRKIPLRQLKKPNDTAESYSSFETGGNMSRLFQNEECK
jgi:hypothetical protein